MDYHAYLIEYSTSFIQRSLAIVSAKSPKRAENLLEEKLKENSLNPKKLNFRVINIIKYKYKEGVIAERVL